MNCLLEKLTFDAKDIVVHCITYPNRSMFLWISAITCVDVNDLHIATPCIGSSIPSISSRIGDNESFGRGVALRLSKKLERPVVVSWNIPDEMFENFGKIESEVLNLVLRPTPTISVS